MTVHDGDPASYELSISEYQRKIIETALMQCDWTKLSRVAGSGEDMPNEFEEWRIFLDMIKDLPRIEAEQPGVHHGLCL